jgi:hypothetical protein
MEVIRIKLDDADTYDSAVHHALAMKEGGDLTIVTKNGAMESGRAAVCIFFSVQLPNGQRMVKENWSTVNLSTSQMLSSWNGSGMVRSGSLT